MLKFILSNYQEVSSALKDQITVVKWLRLQDLQVVGSSPTKLTLDFTMTRITIAIYFLDLNVLSCAIHNHRHSTNVCMREIVKHGSSYAVTYPFTAEASGLVGEGTLKDFMDPCWFRLVVMIVVVVA